SSFTNSVRESILPRSKPLKVLLATSSVATSETVLGPSRSLSRSLAASVILCGASSMTYMEGLAVLRCSHYMVSPNINQQESLGPTAVHLPSSQLIIFTHANTIV